GAGGVAGEDLVGQLVRQRSEDAGGVVPRALRRGLGSGVLARGMGVVGLEQDVVGVLGDGVQGGLLLEPEAAVDLAGEVLARQQVVLGVLEAGTAVAPL